MNADGRPFERSLFQSWIRATTAGWLMGFVIVVILAMAWDVMGGGAEFMVGVGMGAGVGYMQARIVSRAWTGRMQPWFWSSTVGMGAPFVLWDIASMIESNAGFSLPVCVLLGGLLTGVLQRQLLTPHFERASWWILAAVMGWGLPAGAIALVDSGLGPPTFSILSTLAIFFGGVPLGAVTGKALQWMSPRRSNATR